MLKDFDQILFSWFEQFVLSLSLLESSRPMMSDRLVSVGSETSSSSGVLAVVNDIRIRSDLELRADSSSWSPERQCRLSQDIHDYAGHAVALILLRLKDLDRHVHCLDGRMKLAAIRTHVDQVGSDLHRLARDLSVPALKRGSLSDSLRAKADEVRRPLGAALRLECRGDDRDLPEPVADALLHVVEEALTNIMRHAADVANVAIRVVRRRSAVVLIVADDGHRVPARSYSGSGHRPALGLAGMRARVARLGGRIRFPQLTGCGWVVYASIPLRREPG